MIQNDIEKILQQYGEDRRLQQLAADNLHGLARRQRRRALMVCSALLLAAAALTVRLLALPQHTESIIIAQQDSPATSQPHTKETAPQNIHTVAHTKRPASTAIPPSTLPEPAQEEDNTTHESTEPSAIATTQQSGNADTLPESTLPCPPPLPPFTQPLDDEALLLAENTAIQPSYNTGKRFHFTASIGASALPRTGTVAPDHIDFTEQNSFTSNSNSESYTRMSPSSTIAANVGVNYAIPLGQRQRLELGVGLSGYSHQAEATTYQVVAANGIDGSNTVSVHTVGTPETYSTLSLYASLPLTFNFRPKGKDIGWNLSLTPSHSIATSSMLGNHTRNKSVLNPWRLTMGLGLALPRGFIRRLSLTANLLSLYTSSSLHEIGIEIGF